MGLHGARLLPCRQRLQRAIARCTRTSVNRQAPGAQRRPGQQPSHLDVLDIGRMRGSGSGRGAAGAGGSHQCGGSGARQRDWQHVACWPAAAGDHAIGARPIALPRQEAGNQALRGALDLHWGWAAGRGLDRVGGGGAQLHDVLLNAARQNASRRVDCGRAGQGTRCMAGHSPACMGEQRHGRAEHSLRMDAVVGDVGSAAASTAPL